VLEPTLTTLFSIRLASAAVTGLPEPNRDHAVVMVKFAHLCLRKLERLTKELEVQLGPGTADLNGRAGLHSGSVTGGVLRGEKGMQHYSLVIQCRFSDDFETDSFVR
jgi:class 3 adenylate cyclase